MKSSSRKITLGTTYYNCPDLLQEFVYNNLPHVDELIVVDDGSTIDAKSFLKPAPNLKLLEVKADIGFNSHGCRNLIVHQSSNDWIVLLDVDRALLRPKTAFHKFKNMHLNNSYRYLFMAHLEKKGQNVHASVNDYLINKGLFLSVGGYDEEIVGQRWGDREFFMQLRAAGGKEKLLYDIDMILIRSGTSSLLSNDNIISSNHEHTHLKLISDRMITPDPHKPTLQFEWYQVF